jgi:hypothetical protein
VFVLKKVREAHALKVLKVVLLEALFILGFGVFHFAIPFILPPNFVANGTLAGLRIADFVLPGCFALAIASIAFYLTKRWYAGAFLAFLYGGGVVFHVLYLAGLFPSVIIVPDKLILVVGIIVDSLSIIAIYDYYHRLQVPR